MDATDMARKIIKSLTIEEKATLLSQVVWETTGVSKLNKNLTSFLLADKPAGIRRLKEYFDSDIYNTKPSTCYPSPSTYASSWNGELIYQLGQHIGVEARYENVDTMLASAINIKRSPLGGRNFEYYSEDPKLTAELSTEFIRGIQSRGVGACLKRFVANNQETRRMNINVNVDEQTLNEAYLLAFEKPIKAGKPKMIMAAYNQVDGQFCASNEKTLKKLKDWNYEGVVVTDCYAAHDLELGIKNGLTLQMPGETGKKISERIKILIDNKKINEDELNHAIEKNLKFALNASYQREKVINTEYDRKKHHSFARKVAEESIIFLKNDHVLPLNKSDNVLVIGELAKKTRFQGGGSSHVNPFKLENPLEEMQKIGENIDYLPGYSLCDPDKNEKLKQKALANSKKYDYVAVYAGVPDLVESEGYDRKDLKIPEEQNILIEELSKKQNNLIIVLANGAPIEMPWVNNVPSIIEGYLPGEAGASAIARIIFGKVNPSGRLAETFPKKLEDNPSYLNFPGSTKAVRYAEGRFVGYKYYDATKREILFPFGYGLTYTKFNYKKSEEKLVNLDQLRINLTIENIGSYDGKDVVQVYCQPISMDQSLEPKKLVGFKKIKVASGSDENISIKLDSKTFQNFDVISGKWRQIFNEFKIFVGSNCRDIKLEQVVNFQESSSSKIDANCNLGDLLKQKGMYERLSVSFQKHPKSLEFLELTKDADPIKAVSMGSLMTLNTLKRVDDTLTDQDISEIINDLNLKDERVN
ncbi:glycoside hydrolase family 3 C-terminal domain-containing protein [Pediococcus pentosaceus]|uniref:beta-glucosidase n=1 Tax=Pediococcus pentosaceus TaxID=1255 RepID=UPI0018A15496|nr:glycoside hydrolase family 3 C-terminal domain-containing protein [Pediococcus pentosaceus]MBF7140436.1 glycoside hydrolase family 3 C-terminal domain-containing protein [Pediococcus pentosaceus]